MVVADGVGRVVSAVQPALGRSGLPPALRVWRGCVRVLGSAEWGLFAVLLIVLTAFGMLSELSELHGQWTQDWGSGPMPWLTLLLVPVAWAFGELGRCLMWSRWRDQSPIEWRLAWIGVCPVLVLDPDAVKRLRRRTVRMAVHAWGLLHAGLLVALAWCLSRTLDDPEQQWVARAWLYASLIVLWGVMLNPFWPGAAQMLLQDGCRVPDLAARSRAWWLHRGMGLTLSLLGQGQAARARQQGEGHLPLWAIWHAPMGWCAHALLASWLVQNLSARHPRVALFILVMAALVLVLSPLVRTVGFAWRHPGLAARRARGLGALALVALGLAWVLLALPWPRHIMAPAVVGLPEGMAVVSPVDAVIASELALDGQNVYDGQALWALQPLHLQAVNRDADEMLDAPGNWGQVTLRSAGTGLLLWRLPGDPVGRVVRRGQVLAQLVPHTPPVLRWVVPAYKVAELQDVRRVRVRLLEQPEKALYVRAAHLNPRAVRHLPAAAMGTGLGGPVATLPGDPNGLTPAEPLVQLEAPLSQELPRVGGRAWVRMDLAPQALGHQAWAQVRTLWLAGR
jgi:putative peptide zinc metalloprotease protein